MNYYQLIGSILSILGAILILIGGYKQAVSDGKFQSTVVGQVLEQQKINAPRIVALQVTGQYPENLIVIVKNTGNKPAKDVKLIFSDESVPSAFASNVISGLREIPNGTEVKMPLNIFSGINMMLRLQNEDPEYVPKLKKIIDQYNNEQGILIPKFHFEFYSENKKCESETYYLVMSKEKGMMYFGKEDKEAK